MILVHEPRTLIKIILRTIVQKAKVSHAGILLHDRLKDTYILTVSRGPAGLKIPAGLIRLDLHNPLIRFFNSHQDKRISSEGVLIYRKSKRLLNAKKMPAGLKKNLGGALSQLKMLEAVACISSFFRNELLGLLLIGKKIKGEFKKEEFDFFTALASDMAMAVRNAQLFKELELELEKKERLFLNTVISLAAAIEAKDRYTHGHTERVTALCLEIAKRLSQKNKKEFDEKFMAEIHVAALLHDIGKIGIPEAILNKNGSLTDEERAKMWQHSLIGVSILESIKELGDNVLSGIKHHHERYDGTGYPDGKKGEQIPLIASIIALADAFDAMTTDRPYRKASPREKAINEIRGLSGKQFAPEVVEALLEIFGT